MIAIFTRIEDESGTVLDLKNEESTCNSLNKDLKILLRLLNNDINNRKNSVSNKFNKKRHFDSSTSNTTTQNCRIGL